MAKVFFDVDDTVNNFSLDYARSFGFPSHGRWYNPACGYNLMEAMREHRKQQLRWKPKNLKERFQRLFWKPIPDGDLPEIKKTFWTKLKPCNLNLIDCAGELFGKENVFIATKPQMNPGCLTGKLVWIQKHLPKWIHEQLFIATHKHLLGQPGHILVDDRQQTLEDFAALGGTPIGIPRPWNSYTENPLNSLLAACIKLNRNVELSVKEHFDE